MSDELRTLSLTHHSSLITHHFSLISKRAHGVEVGGANSRVERAECAAEQSDERGGQAPRPTVLKQQAVGALDHVARGEGKGEAGDDADDAYENGLLLDLADDEGAGGSERLKDSDLARPLRDRRVHREHDDEHAHHSRQPDERAEEDAEVRDALLDVCDDVARELN